MPLKKYGIFLAYPPTVDLRAEGLGRYLAEFLKAAQGRKDVGFVIACPSWTVDILRELCLEVGVQIEKIEFVSPRHKPVLLRMYECYRWFRQRRGSLSVYTRLLSKLKRVQHLFYDYLIGKLVSIRHWMIFMLFGVPLLPFVFLIIMFSSVRILWRVIFLLVRKILQHFLKGEKVRKQRERLMRALSQPKLDSSVVRMYHYMAEGETSLLLGLIAKRKDILAWYCPAAFWPQFNEIASPRLMCVPDVVLGDFPVGFAAIGGERFLNNFRQVEKAIKGGKYYITYSQYVKWQTLVRRYHIKPDDVFVVPHGVNRLDEVINISIFDTNSDSATRKLCHDFFRTALLKSVKREYANFIVNSSEINYLFYASQFRPNKNVVNLLRAYNYLLKQRYIKQKLILTGNPSVLPEIERFISEHNLENDVLCLHGLTAQELAACYYLADLAVNPSLFEGGVPFTFAEAVSVGTPVVMARIPVTEEILSDPELSTETLFNPFDWRDMAAKIEWALENRHLLYAKQRKFYDEVLAKRTWAEVVDEYIEILDRIAQSGKEEKLCCSKGC